MARFKLVAGRKKTFGDCAVIPGFVSGSVRRIDADYQPVWQPRMFKRQREITLTYKPPGNNDALGLYEATEKPFTIGVTYTIGGVDKNVTYEVVLKEVLLDTDAADVQTITAIFLMEDDRFKDMIVLQPHP